MGKAIYFSDDELLFLRHEALEDVPPTFLSEKELKMLERLKEKLSQAIDATK